MSTQQVVETSQAALWNGTAGHAWVDTQDLIDEVFSPFERLLADAAVAAGAGSVLDVGCGTGGTTLAVARALEDGSRCVGIDISEPMIVAARARAERDGIAADFICDDAQDHRFETAGFDLIVSRFGVMFFNEPMEAFANMRRATRAGGRLQVIAWRGAEENPFMTTAERAAAPLLPHMPARDPDAPGQFAFADEHRVRRILDASGWSEISITPLDVACTFPAADLDHYFTRLGPLGRVLQEVGEPTRSRVVDTVCEAFSPYVHGNEVRFTAACWMIGARA
jgi:SAM-dependent methyltransferase